MADMAGRKHSTKNYQNFLRVTEGVQWCGWRLIAYALHGPAKRNSKRKLASRMMQASNHGAYLHRASSFNGTVTADS